MFCGGMIINMSHNSIRGVPRTIMYARYVCMYCIQYYSTVYILKWLRWTRLEPCRNYK